MPKSAGKIKSGRVEGDKCRVTSDTIRQDVVRACPLSPGQNDAVGIQRKGAKWQRRKVGTANPENDADGAGIHQMVPSKSRTDVLKILAPLRLRLCVKSLLHRSGRGRAGVRASLVILTSRWRFMGSPDLQNRMHIGPMNRAPVHGEPPLPVVAHWDHELSDGSAGLPTRLDGASFETSRVRACLSAPWKGAGLQWESRKMKPTRQFTLQPVAAERWREAMKSAKPLVQKARKRVSE